MALTHDPMTPTITAFSDTPINRDITSVADMYPQEHPVGYRITLELMTARFKISGECELMQYPLTDSEMQAKLIEALKEDFKEASQHIEPLIYQ